MVYETARARLLPETHDLAQENANVRAAIGEKRQGAGANSFLGRPDTSTKGTKVPEPSSAAASQVDEAAQSGKTHSREHVRLWQYEVESSGVEKSLQLQLTTSRKALKKGKLDQVTSSKLSRQLNELKRSVVNCSICQDPIVDGQVCARLPCGHSGFHWNCGEQASIGAWVKDNKSCPVCRAVVALHQLVKQPFDQQMKAEHLLKAVEISYQNQTGVHGSDINGAKITAMLRELMKIKAADTADNGSKIIMFSKWPEMLKRVEAGLERNKIASAYPSGKGADGTKNDPTNNWTTSRHRRRHLSCCFWWMKVQKASISPRPTMCSSPRP